MSITSLFQQKGVEELEKLFKAREERRKVKAEYKLSKKENKLREKKKRKSLKEKQYWFNFFTKWFFLGIILILLSICVSMYVNGIESTSSMYVLRPILVIIAGMLSTVGIALFVGCIFDFSKNSEAFIGFVSNILSDIVVSKKFLSTLSVKDKEQALNLILKPMDSQVEQYANINNFFKKKIKESMTMFDANFKTNVILNIEAHKDVKNNYVYCETTLTYTIYKLNNKFEPIRIIFEKANSTTSDVEVLYESGEEKIPMGNPQIQEIGGINYTAYTFTIPEALEKYDHLTVKRTMTEPGRDHWINYCWQSLTPYEGVTCRVKCFDNLTIKDFMIFDNKAFYHVDISDDKTRMDITSSQWLDADTGFCFVISE